MTTLPGVDVQISDHPALSVAPDGAGNWLVAGTAERGPVDRALLVTNLAAFVSAFGGRLADSPLYDALDVYFREGGRYAYVSRIVGPAAAASGENVLDGDDATVMSVEAANPGVWGDSVEVTVTVTGATFVIEVTDGTSTETSPALTSNAEAVAWAAASSKLITISAASADLPVTQTITLTGGDDDSDGVTQTEIDAALERLGGDLGQGQVSLPGLTGSDAHESLLAHAAKYKRIAKLDCQDISTVATLTAAAIALRDVDGHRLAAAFAPWDRCPGIALGTERVVPPSARNAALLARSLAEGRTEGDPAAGMRLPARYVSGLEHEFTDDEREELNDAGINVSVVRGSDTFAFGNRTLTSTVSESNWSQLSQAQVIAAIAHRGGQIGERYAHSKIDGGGVKVGEFVGELQDLCMQFLGQRDLYELEGEGPASAFTITPSVELGSSDAQLLATIEARVSPGADRVEISIVKTPIA